MLLTDHPVKRIRTNGSRFMLTLYIAQCLNLRLPTSQHSAPCVKQRNSVFHHATSHSKGFTTVHHLATQR